MKKSYILNQHLRKLRVLLRKLGYNEEDTAVFLRKTVYCAMCENCGLFLGRPFSSLIHNTPPHFLGQRLSEFFDSLPDSDFPQEFFLNLEIQNSLIAFVSEDWSDISPALLGEIYLSAAEQSQSGAFYTSAENIDRILDNLVFCDKAKTQKAFDAVFFDPACGCGNFLVRTVERLSAVELTTPPVSYESRINIQNLRGIDNDSSAVHIARSALFIAKRQSEIAYAEHFGYELSMLTPELPEQVLCRNAMNFDWSAFNPDYIIGNPPFVSRMNYEQRSELTAIGGPADIDYCGGWVIQAAKLVSRTGTECAFLLSSSVCQGNQVKAVWEAFQEQIDINFAYQPFHWSEDGSSSAQVWCVIVGFSAKNSRTKRLYSAPEFKPEICEHINFHLQSRPDMIIEPSLESIFNAPPMRQGKFDSCEGLVTGKFLKKSGAEHFSVYVTAKSMIESIYLYYPEEQEQKKSNYIVIPRHTSENRKIIPIEYFENASLRFNSSVHYIANANYFLFGLLCSKMHMAFTKNYCGRLEMRYRYSNTLIYNNFYIPHVPYGEERNKIRLLAQDILLTRKKYRKTMSLGELYDKLPEDLELCHRRLDCAVDKLYCGKICSSDKERVRFLYEKYCEQKNNPVMRDRM